MADQRQADATPQPGQHNVITRDVEPPHSLGRAGMQAPNHHGRIPQRDNSPDCGSEGEKRMCNELHGLVGLRRSATTCPPHAPCAPSATAVTPTLESRRRVIPTVNASQIIRWMHCQRIGIGGWSLPCNPSRRPRRPPTARIDHDPKRRPLHTALNGKSSDYHWH